MNIHRRNIFHLVFFLETYIFTLFPECFTHNIYAVNQHFNKLYDYKKSMA